MSTDKIVSFIILLIVGLAMTTVIKSSCDDAIQGSPIYHTNATVNSAFSDNTGNVPDNWENYIIGSVVVNAWNASGYVTTTRTDNADDYENGIWYQSLSLGNIYDGVTIARVSYKHRVIDNENAASIVIEVLLGDGTDNTRLIYDNVTDSKSASWTRVENTITDNISATGTYTIWLKTEINPTHEDAGAGTSNCQVGWDEVSITVTTAEDNPMTGAPKVMLQLVPLFYVIGILLTAVAWISKGFKG